MNLAGFTKSVLLAAPSSELSPPLAALWWAARGDWDRAHAIVMKDDGAQAAWVHAYLHRVEGDLPNAGYWYRAAGKPAAAGSLDSEWGAIVEELLAGAGD